MSGFSRENLTLFKKSTKISEEVSAYTWFADWFTIILN